MSGPEPGLEILPGLTLLRRLGRGGMGEAWLARDRERGLDVVAKLLPEGATPERVALLRREARLVRKLQHPRIVPVYAFHEGAHGGLITQRHMPGGDAGRLRRAGVAEIVSLGRDVADALAYLHGLGVVHRDLKASNVLLDEAGRAHLADFGIAALAEGGGDELVVRGGGSRGSMSPQQRAGSPPQPADDLYALGTLLQELLAGEPPPGAGTWPAGVPPRLRALVAALVAPEPLDRPRSAKSVRDELDAIRSELTQDAARRERTAVRLQAPPRAAEPVTQGLAGAERLRPDGRSVAPWQLAMLLALALLAVLSIVWLPSWARTPASSTGAGETKPAARQAPPRPVPEAARQPPEATPQATPAAAAKIVPTAAPGAAAARPAATEPRGPEPAPAATPDSAAEAEALGRHRDAGLAFEGREEWPAALREYEAALAIDPHVSFALEGLERARQRAELDAALAFHQQHPDRLSAPAVAREVEVLLERARGAQPVGPKLAAHLAAVEAALALAKTPVTVVIESDGRTELTLSRVGPLGPLRHRSLELLPGRYTLTGSRVGYRDVRLEFLVSAGGPTPSIVLRCQEVL